MELTDDTRFECKGAKFASLAAAIDHATRTYADPPAIMESALDADGEGWSWVAVHCPVAGDNGTEYIREEFVRD